MPTRAPSHSQAWGRRVKDMAYRQQQKWRAEQEVYKSLRWRQLRARVLREQPLCKDLYGWHAEDHRLVPAVQVDHIVPLRVDRGLAYVRGNLQGLCARCHRVKTQEDLVKYPIGIDRRGESSTIRSSRRPRQEPWEERSPRMSEPGEVPEEEPQEAPDEPEEAPEEEPAQEEGAGG